MELIDNIRRINSDFSLVSNHNTINDNINELFLLCKENLGKDIIFFAPYFYTLEDWDTLKISPIIDYRYFTHAEQKDFDNF